MGIAVTWPGVNDASAFACHPPKSLTIVTPVLDSLTPELTQARLFFGIKSLRGRDFSPSGRTGSDDRKQSWLEYG